MHVEFTLEAKVEFEDGERYYECQLLGLGAHSCPGVTSVIINIHYPRLHSMDLLAIFSIGSVLIPRIDRIYGFPWKLALQSSVTLPLGVYD